MPIKFEQVTPELVIRIHQIIQLGAHALLLTVHGRFVEGATTSRLADRRSASATSAGANGSPK